MRELFPLPFFAQELPAVVPVNFSGEVYDDGEENRRFC